MNVYDLVWLIASFIAVVIVSTCHEFAHAFVAYKCGDPTPKWEKRLSLNPLRHFDPLGLVCFTFVGFGWAKPVAINPNNFKNYKKGLALTACAGIVVNYIMAFLLYPVYLVVVNYCGGISYAAYYFLSSVTFSLFAYSLSFCVFNLLPLYPLDGFRIIEALNRRRGKVYRFLRKYGYYILLGLIIESFVCRTLSNFGVPYAQYLNILNWIMLFATDIFGFPIKALWGLIPW